MIKTTHKVSNITLLILSMAALSTVNFVSRANKLNLWYKYKNKAAQLMLDAERIIKEEKIARGIPVDKVNDPNATGLIGEDITPITTDKGFIDMKLMATNPNLAAVIVDMFKEAGLKPGNLVAVGYTGSFPGANLAVLAAIESLGLEAVIISSVGASNWGANNPNFTWLDMENILFTKGIIKHRSVAASLGGSRDEAADLSPEAKRMMEIAIKRNNLIYINEGNIEANVYKRLELYKKFAREKGKKIKCYINTGGGIASLGSSVNGAIIPAGLSRKPSLGKLRKVGVIVNMAQNGASIIHLLKIREIAYEYGLPAVPPSPPVIGQGKVFLEERYSSSVALLGLIFLIAVIFIGLSVDVILIPRFKLR